MHKFELKGWEHSGRRAPCDICGWQDKFVDFATGEEGDHHLQICRECIEGGNLDAKLEEEAAKEIASIAEREASATKRAAFLRSLRGRLEVRLTEGTSVHAMGESDKDAKTPQSPDPRHAGRARLNLVAG